MEDEKNIFELTIDNIDFDGVTAISIVEFPAIEVDFQYFSKPKQNLTFAVQNDEKMIITGPALIPDKEIYRYDFNAQEEYYVYFSQDTVKKISEQFLIQNKNHSISLEHQTNINDVSLIESWLVENPENDKSNELGYVVNKGTWMVSLKINNETIWNDFVKTGLVKGFSIEGFFTTKFDNYSKVNINEDEKILNEIKRLIKEEENKS